MGHNFPDIGMMEKIWGFMLRPHLHITHKGDRKVEEVAIHYHEETELSSAYTTCSGTLSTLSSGRSRYVRAWVYNMWGPKAHRCRVVLERIWLNERLIDDERTPLHWTDLKDVYELPEMSSGFRNGHWIDVCASDSVKSRLQVISQRHLLRGYHSFSEHGLYRFQLVAECSNWHWKGTAFITVRYDGHWDNLRVVAINEKNPVFFGLCRR
jgi:hypothetical protein